MRLNPCIESLNDMKPVEGGRYCGSCAKTIVDLTNKSNQEIRQLYDEHNGKLCGIVMPNQLQENKYYHPLKRFALALIIVFGTSLFVFANANGFNQFRNQAIGQLKQAEVKLQVKGFVFGEGNPLIGAKVIASVNGIDYTGFSSVNGEFKIDIPQEYSGDITIKYIHAGYKTITKSFHVKDGMTSLFTGRVNLNKEMENCVKGKIAIDPIEEEKEYEHKTAGIIALPPEEEPIEIQKKGEVIAPDIQSLDTLYEEKSPVGGGIEAPEEYEKGDIAPKRKDELKFD
ncbi:hypothetical protein [Parvicella tangerina]|uniref:Carboxypeptidase-like regulatory domain-containing protein n=1 Tax=Parvicella tangerina TaxID=2829795 RepID=A0A916JMW1_9FLAO|nr:hypothetical protein [Parvicella tangerina]CAG5081605.1 hypothetical protein CRYO30217_01682 [Parvicella tangerina]